MGLTREQGRALRLVEQTHPDVDAVITSDATFWDTEIDAAYVHWRTAHWLMERGYVRFERVPGGDEDLWAIRLTRVGRDRVAQMPVEPPLRRR